MNILFIFLCLQQFFFLLSLRAK